MGPGLRQGFEALEHSAVAIRSMFRTVADATTEPSGLDVENAEDVLLALAQTLRDLAAGIDAFGALVRNEAGAALLMGLRACKRCATRWRACTRRGPGSRTCSTTTRLPDLVELHAVVVTTVKRLLAEMIYSSGSAARSELGRDNPGAAGGPRQTRGETPDSDPRRGHRERGDLNHFRGFVATHRTRPEP